MGLRPEDFDQEVNIWPENWAAFRCFDTLLTQWRAGPGGIVGLDYGVLFSYLDRQGLSGKAWDQMFNDIRVMEQAALAAIQE